MVNTKETTGRQWAVRTEAPPSAEEEFIVALPDGRLFGRTRDYSVFELPPTNRKIDKDALDKLVKENREVDLLPEYPIVVYAAPSGKWVILDGQHRWAMAQINRRLLYFTVSEKMTMEHVAAANSTQKHWTTADFLHHWAASGKGEYKKLQEFIDRHPWIKVNTAKDLCTYGDRKRQDFAGGNYLANDLEFAEEVARACEGWAGLIDWWGETTFVYAIAMAHEHDGFDHGRLLRKARQQIGSLHKCVNVEQYMALLDEVYNHQMREGNRLRLEKLVSNSTRRRPERRYRHRRGEGAE